ncbi:MAG: ribosome maturation factor RimP [Clostridia bacterium]|nr:ribosome maturation factor RimP [Clostridia bacterium]
MSKIEEIAEKEASAICEKEGLYVYEVEYKKEGSDMVLRIFIDSDTGVTLDDCEKVSRALSDRFDEIDPIKTPYELELSSPGIERLLTRPWHFDKVIGDKISVKLFKPIDGMKNLTGILKEADDETFTVELGEKTMKIEKNKASQIKTVFEF